MPTISEITPTKKERVIDLVSSLGIDTTSWGDFKGGQERASTNPKFCYEWNFDSDKDFIVVNFWTHQFKETDGEIIWSQNLDVFTEAGNATQRARGKRLYAALQRAFELQQPVRVIICHGDRRRDGGRSSVKSRSLDKFSWHVTEFDIVTNRCSVSRGGKSNAEQFEIDIRSEAITDGFEGKEAIRWYVSHRHREARLRNDKINLALKSNGGRLKCEVPRCGFDFLEKYGSIGKGFAHVHHLTALNKYPPEGKKTQMSELAIVCANCHSMVHRGGKCRNLSSLIPEI